MLKNKDNLWPAFVDLFSNLTIILMFLLIVFAVISSAFKHIDAPANDVAKFQDKINEQAEIITLLQNEKSAMDSQTFDINRQKAMIAEEAAINEARAVEMQAEIDAQMAELVAKERELTELLANNTELELSKAEQEMTAQKLAELSQEISKLANALAVSEQRAAEREVQYIELSTRFNRALADKLAEMGDMREFQSAFYTAIKKALGNSDLIKMDDDRFTLPSDIMFASGSAKISRAGKHQLQQIAIAIKELYETIPNNVAWIIRIDGHTDSRKVIKGSKIKDNIELSLLRARAVADELAASGIDRKFLVPSGFGEQYPIAMGTAPEALSKNRRIELRLTNP